MSRVTAKASTEPREPTYLERFIWYYTPKCAHCKQRFSTCAANLMDASAFYARLLVPRWRVDACKAARGE